MYASARAGALMRLGRAHKSVDAPPRRQGGLQAASPMSTKKILGRALILRGTVLDDAGPAAAGYCT